LTCTDSLQTFHHPKQRHYGSPVKAQALQLGNVKSDCVIFNPVPADYCESQEQLNCRIRNETINYAASSHCSVPLLQCYTPANIDAFNNDHDYLKLSPADNFLLSEHISPEGISIFHAENIEHLTRGQSFSKEWHSERCKRLQSSNFGHIVKASNKTDMIKLAASLMTARDEIFAKPVVHGRKYESVAIDNYEAQMGVSVDKCGIIVDLERPYLGCSPDGLVGLERVVEVKCPYTARNADVSLESVPFLELDDQTDQLRLSASHDYVSNSGSFTHHQAEIL